MTHAVNSLKRKEVITETVGRQLSSVTFVQDYLQFAFAGPVLTTYTLPTVSSRTESFKSGEAGYRDALCVQIGETVRQIELDKKHVSLLFDNGAAISVSLLDKDYVGPEALMFSLDPNRGWIVV